MRHSRPTLRTLVLLSGLLALPPAAAEEPPAADEVILVAGNRLQEVRFRGGLWDREKSWVEARGEGRYLLASRQLGPGDFVVRARISLDHADRSGAAFVIGDGEFGFASEKGKSSLYYSGRILHGGKSKVTTIPDTEGYIRDGDRHDFEARREGTRLQFLLDGRPMALAVVSPDALGAFGFHAARATLRIYSFTVQGNLITPPDTTSADIAALQPEIDKALDRGVVWLLDAQQRDGSWGHREKEYRGGTTALCVYALLKAEISPEHPAIQRALHYLACTQPNETYTISCHLLALEATHEARHRKRMQELLDRMLRWQKGGWSYPWSREDGQWTSRIARNDLSNTQFAALGLRAAARAGLEVPDAVWEALAKNVLSHRYHREKVETEVPPGETGVAEMEVVGFSYYGPDSVYGVREPTGSMTAAGVATLEICRQNLGDELSPRLGAHIDEARTLGLQWLAHYFTVTENPNNQSWHIYYLYGLERVGSLLEIDLIGQHNWYLEGAKQLISQQGRDGEWHNAPDTSFAILFLRRATAPTTRREVTRKMGVYASEDPQASVGLRAEGESPLAIWITAIQRDATVRLTDPLVGGLRIARVEYLVDGRIVGVVTGNPARAWRTEDFRLHHHFDRPGTYQVNARVHIVAPGAPLGATQPEVVLEGNAFPATIHAVYSHWALRAAEAAKHNLLDPANATAQTSSERRGDRGEEAADGFQSSRWACDTEDSAPWIALLLRKPIRASTLVLSQADSREKQRNERDRITEVAVRINRAKTPLVCPLDPDYLRPTAIRLPEVTRVRQVEIHITKRVPGRKRAGQAGFTEIGLELEEVEPPVIEQDPTGEIRLDCATEGAEIHYTLDGSDPTVTSPRYEGPFVRHDPTRVQARAYAASGAASRLATCYLEGTGQPVGAGRSRWVILDADSETPGAGLARQALDGVPETAWQPDQENASHFLTIDMGEVLLLEGFTCLPPVDDKKGRVRSYRFLAGTEVRAWGPPLHSGTWPDGPHLQVVRFPQPLEARYLRIEARSLPEAPAPVALAELDVLVAPTR